MGNVVGLGAGLVLAVAAVRLGYLCVRGAAGRWVERWVAAVRGRPLRLVVAGATSAAVLHSSGAVEVMVLALSQTGSLTLDEALFVIVGANVGTTATAQLVALRLPGAGLLLMVAGLAALLLSHRHPAALALFSLGCFLSGLELVGAATGPLVAAHLASLGRGGDSPVARAFWLGWVLTGLVQSSTAVSSAAVTMVTQDVLEPRAAVAIVLGSNVGTVTTGLVASLFLGRGARWLAAADFVLNLSGALLALALFGLFYRAVTLLAASPAQVVAHAHTLFNLLVALVALPLVRPAARWAGGRVLR